jgi:hypothetical protein
MSKKPDDRSGIVLTDVFGWRSSADALHVELIFATADGSKHSIRIDPAALMHLVPIAAIFQPWREEAGRENARTLRTYIDVDSFVLAIDTADRSKMMLSIRLVSGGSLTFRFDRSLARSLRDTLLSAGLE